MKIVGGTFGIAGDAFVSSDGELVVRGAKEGRFARQDITSVNTRVDKEKTFGCLGFIVGSILLSIPLGIFLNVLGILLAVIIAGAGSFYANKINMLTWRLQTATALAWRARPAE